MNRLGGMVAVITGGTSGFGFATAELFLQEGATVLVLARDKEKGKSVSENLGKRAGRHVPFI